MVEYFLYNLLSVNSFWHFVIPFLLARYWLKENWKCGIWVLLAFELFEAQTGYMGPEPLINTFADIIIGIAGLYYGSKYKVK